MRMTSKNVFHATVRGLAAAALALAAVQVAAAQSYQPARLKSGDLPRRAVLGVGGGEVLLEVTVGADGSVTRIKPLRATATFTEALTAAVSGWEFAPALQRAPDAPADADPTPVESTIVVAGFFRPPSLMEPTFGEPIQTVGASSSGAPAVLETAMPPYPPVALNPGTVLAQIDIDARGSVETRIVRAMPPFDAVVTDTLRSWRFAPARGAGGALPSRVYAFFDFPQPIVSNTVH